MATTNRIRRAPPIGSQPAYTRDAGLYDSRTNAFQGFRRAIVDALPVGGGDVVLDVGCGTGLCFPMVRDKIGAHGLIVGIEASPQMAAVARERVSHHGWRNVVVVARPVQYAQIPVAADAALFCAVHDILRSPQALRRAVASLRPGAWIAAGGGKWAPPSMIALNVQVRALHAPYVSSFEGFDRPYSHLERLVGGLRIEELAFGGGFVATGRVPVGGKARERISDRL